jgi:hypothetical protein
VRFQATVPERNQLSEPGIRSHRLTESRPRFRSR